MSTGEVADPLTEAYVDTWQSNLNNTVWFGAETVRVALRGEPVTIGGGGPVVVTWPVLKFFIEQLAAEIKAAVDDLNRKTDPFAGPPEMRSVAAGGDSLPS